MLADTRVLNRHGAFAVLGERQAIVFRDNTVVYLHRVQHAGVDDTFFRALQLERSHWCVFDLRKIHNDFVVDLGALLARDHPGVILYTLRQHFAGDARFIAHAFANFRHVWSESVEAEPLIIEGDAPVERITFQPALQPRATIVKEAA